jgi:hypothetical protein
MEDRTDSPNDTDEYQYEMSLGYDEDAMVWNQPSAKLDLKYWSKMPYWAIDEAVAVLLDKNPAKVKHRVVKACQAEYGDIDFCRRYIDLHRLLYRAVAEQHILVRDKPANYLQCAKKLGIEVKPELEKMVMKFAESFVDWESKYKTLKREFESLEAELHSLQKDLSE